MEDARKSSRVTTKRGYTAWSSGTSSFKILSVSSSASRVWIVRGFYSQAEIQEDMLHMDLSTFQPRQPLSAADLFHSSLNYIPPTIRREISKTFYVGFSPSSTPLLTPSKHPTAYRRLRRSLKPRWILTPVPSTFVLGKGGGWSISLMRGYCEGLVESWGWGVCHEEGGKGGKLGYRKLERCANDLKFGGGGLGVGIRNRWCGGVLFG